MDQPDATLSGLTLSPGAVNVFLPAAILVSIRANFDTSQMNWLAAIDI